MTYLDLINAVLVRLRENPVTTDNFQQDPYYRMIGASVNDAKDIVENAWQWSQLRGTDEVSVLQGATQVTLPDSAERDYLISSILVQESGAYLRWAPLDWIKARYRNRYNKPVDQGNTFYYGFDLDDPTTGNQTIAIYPPTNKNINLNVSNVAHQQNLSNWDDRLLVPALPVYSMATALASRERGEVGGAPVSELFTFADRVLSDAIAYDSSRFPEELIWYSPENLPETNVRGY